MTPQQCLHCSYIPELEITGVVFQTLSELHLNSEEVIVVLLEFLSASELIVESLPRLLKVSKRVV